MTIKKEYLFNIQGTDFVKYAGLLDEAHQQGLCRVSTTLVQIPDDLNGHTAIVHAEVETPKGTFSGLGDANPNNVGRMIVPHLLRMAETRSIARALRLAVNIGATSVEELISLDDVKDQKGQQPERAATPPNQTAPRPTGTPKASPNRPASANQLATVEKLSRLLGKTMPDDAEHWTSEQASNRITELSRSYNELKGNTLTKRSA